jgi:hypothetical protein
MPFHTRGAARAHGISVCIRGSGRRHRRIAQAQWCHGCSRAWTCCEACSGQTSPRHPARQLLVHIARLINQRAADGVATRLVKVKAHAGDPLNEAADTLASDAAELDPSQSKEVDPEGLHFGCRGALVPWNSRLRRELTQVAAARWVACSRRRRSRRVSVSCPPRRDLCRRFSPPTPPPDGRRYLACSQRSRCRCCRGGWQHRHHYRQGRASSLRPATIC